MSSVKQESAMEYRIWMDAIENKLKQASIRYEIAEGFPLVEITSLSDFRALHALDFSVPVKFLPDEQSLFIIPDCPVLVQLEGIMARSIG